MSSMTSLCGCLTINLSSFDWSMSLNNLFFEIRDRKNNNTQLNKNLDDIDVIYNDRINPPQIQCLMINNRFTSGGSPTASSYTILNAQYEDTPSFPVSPQTQILAPTALGGAFTTTNITSIGIVSYTGSEIFSAIYSGGDSENYLLQFRQNNVISVDENIPEVGLTDVVLSENAIENTVLDLNIVDSLNDTGEGTSDLVYIGNSVNTKLTTNISKSTSTNGVNGDNKTITNEIEVIIDETNNITNNVSEVIHSSFSKSSLSNTGTKNINNSSNISYDGTIDKAITRYNGDVDE